MLFFQATLTLPWMNSWQVQAEMNSREPGSIWNTVLPRKKCAKKWKRYTAITAIKSYVICIESLCFIDFHWIKHDKTFSSDLDPTPNPETRPGGHRAELRTGSTTQPWNHETGKTFFGKTFLATTSTFRWSVGLWRLNCEKSSPIVQRPYSYHPRDWSIYGSMKIIKKTKPFIDR